jgi:hypothetical protein
MTIHGPIRLDDAGEAVNATIVIDPDGSRRVEAHLDSAVIKQERQPSPVTSASDTE